MLKLFVTDVDGVMTDGSMYYSERGDELKRFSTYDGMAIEILKNLNILTCIITSENSQIVTRRAEKLKVDFVYQGCAFEGKLSTIQKLVSTLGISMENVAYIGDDINCKDLLAEVGYRACPYNARREIKNIDEIVILATKGGDGVLREWVEFLLEKRVV